MEVNVSQLLQASIGNTRDFSLDEPILIIDESESRVTGTLRVTKTHRGVLVQGAVETKVPMECSRCLKTFKNKLTFDVEEEYFPCLDIKSGNPLDTPDEPDSFLIDEHHILDLNEAIRQNALLAIPMKPLCRKDCAGLCQICGRDLNKAHCDCDKGIIDPRWAKLTDLVEAGKKSKKRKKETE